MEITQTEKKPAKAKKNLRRMEIEKSMDKNEFEKEVGGTRSIRSMVKPLRSLSSIEYDNVFML